MEQQLKNTLKDILEAVREQRQQEYGRRGKGKGGLEELDSGDDG